MVRDLIRPNLKPMFLYNTIADFQYAFNDFNNFEKINIYNSIKEIYGKLKKAKAKTDQRREKKFI